VGWYRPRKRREQGSTESKAGIAKKGLPLVRVMPVPRPEGNELSPQQVLGDIPDGGRAQLAFKLRV
jgi:hypothetical protein